MGDFPALRFSGSLLCSSGCAKHLLQKPNNCQAELDQTTFLQGGGLDLRVFDIHPAAISEDSFHCKRAARTMWARVSVKILSSGPTYLPISYLIELL